MSGRQYKNPPITEAVIEVRFAEPSDPTDLSKASAKFAQLYPHEQMMKNYEVRLDIPGPDNHPSAQFQHEQNVHRRTSADLSKFLLLSPTNIVISQLSPYTGWKTLFDRFVRDWKIWTKFKGYQKIIRVGVRFINRIDIPIHNGIAEQEEHLNVYPKLPDGMKDPLSGYGVQVQYPLTDIGCTLTINSAAVPSPLLGYGSVLLDIDVSMIADPPQSDVALYSLLNTIHNKKNEIFEACVTDKARELFET